MNYLSSDTTSHNMEFSSGAIEGTSKASMILPLGLISAKLVDKIKGRKFLVYLPQRSWGKVMFLHVSVILFTWGSASVHAGIPPTSGSRTPPEQTPPPGVDNPPPPAPGRLHAGRYGREAGGTHLTGMHSCLADHFLRTPIFTCS